MWCGCGGYLQQFFDASIFVEIFKKAGNFWGSKLGNIIRTYLRPPLPSNSSIKHWSWKEDGSKRMQRIAKDFIILMERSARS